MRCGGVGACVRSGRVDCWLQWLPSLTLPELATLAKLKDEASIRELLRPDPTESPAGGGSGDRRGGGAVVSTMQRSKAPPLAARRGSAKELA